MNVQKIFEALELDSQNSALGIICTELERQEYTVHMNAIPLTSESFFEGELTDIENKTDPINVEIFKDGNLEQKFSIEFTDFHEISITK
jgi:hypothetical protein